MNHIVIAVFMAAIPFGMACRAQDASTRPSRPVPQFDPAFGAVLAFVGDRVAWTRYDARAWTGGGIPIIQSYAISYYVQRVGKEPVLAFQGNGRRTVDDRATILQDGTILVWRTEHMPESLLWIHSGKIQQRVRPKDAERLGSVMALFSTGVVSVTFGGTHPARTIWWVPIQKGEVDIDHRVKMGTGTSTKFLKSGDQVAWIDSIELAAGGEPAETGPLNVFDIVRGRTRRMKIQTSVRQAGGLDMFDGHYGIDTPLLIDASNGRTEVISAIEHGRGVRRIIPLALVDKRAYFVFDRLDSFEVMAVPVDDLAHGKIVYHIARSALAKESLQQHLSAKNLFFASEKTIYAWNGTTWENILAKP